MRRKKNAPIDNALPWFIAKRIEEDPSSPHAKRVNHILELLCKLKDFVGLYGAIEIMSELRALLDRYRFKFNISVGRKISTGLSAAAENLSQDDAWEYGAVQTIMELANKPGGLSRIRRCKRCDRWIFALSRSDQKFCNEPGRFCRQEFYAKDEKVTERRRTKMSERYYLLKRMKKNSKSGVGLNKPKSRATGR